MVFNSPEKTDQSPMTLDQLAQALADLLIMQIDETYAQKRSANLKGSKRPKTNDEVEGNHQKYAPPNS